MKKIDLPLYSDTLFFAACGGLLSLCILRYYRLNMWLSVLLSILFAILVGVGTFLFLYRKRKKQFNTTKDKEETEKLKLHLALSSKEANEKLFAPLLSESKTTIYLLFRMQPISADAIAEKLRITPTEKQFGVFCNRLSEEATTLCDEFDIKVTQIETLYRELKERNLLPATYICGEKKRRGTKEKLKTSFSKKNSRSFFVSGAALAILSFFSFFPVYYVICASVLLLLSLFIRIFGYA